MDLNLDYVRAQLERRKDQRQLAAVARGTKLSTRTLTYIIAGRSGHIDTIKTLQEYLQRTEGQKKLEESGHNKA